MKNERVTTDFAEGFRAGFEAARVELEVAVSKALTDYRSVMKAMRAVEMPSPKRQGDKE
jgi:hypothetical protein